MILDWRSFHTLWAFEGKLLQVKDVQCAVWALEDKKRLVFELIMLLIFFLVLASIALTVDSFSIGNNFGSFGSRSVKTPFRPRQSKIEMKYCLNVKLSVNPAKREEFLAAIRTNAKGTLTNEPGCRGYLWGESATSPNVFHFQEQFDNKESFLEHTKAPHFQVWEAFAQQNDAFTAPPIIDFFDEMKWRQGKRG